MSNIYPIKDISRLEQDQFYDALISGRLNSLDLSAREYFERQELIREQVKKREILKQVEDSGESYYYIHKKGTRGDGYDMPKFAIAFFVTAHTKPEIIFFPSKEERDRTVEYFQRTGTLRYYNQLKNSEEEMDVSSLAPISIDGIYARDDIYEAYSLP